MNRILCALAAGALAAVLTATAYAADFTHCADSMQEMGLFLGTGQDYELDRAATRAEAGVMMVRLLGREAEAKAENHTTPFTDVPAWAAPYIGWLYANDLTAGMSDTRYGAAQTVTAQQYATFLLRALGYDDRAGDFAYADALTFAQDKGVADGICCDPDRFLRDEVVAMSYTALSRPTQEGAVCLLQALVDQGAVSRAAASNYLLRFSNHRGYAQAVTGARAIDRKATQITTDLVVIQGGKTVAQTSLHTEAAYVRADDEDDSRYAAVTRAQDQVVGAMYYDGGTLYRLVNGKTERTQTSFEALETDLADALPISLFQRVQYAGTAGGIATYTLTCAPALADRLVDENAAQLGFSSLTGSGFSIDKLVYTVSTDNAGRLNRKQAEMGLTTQLGGRNAGVTIRMDSYLSGLDDEVRVEIPDALDV